jgi:short-subunit dehydrogenase
MRRAVLITGASTGIGAIYADRLTRLANAAAPRFAQAEKVPSSISLPCSASRQRCATRTEIQEHAGVDIRTTRGVMEAGELVDAAFVGFDRREPVSIPPLPDASQWSAFDTSRQAMLPNFTQAHVAERYRSAAR